MATITARNPNLAPRRQESTPISHATKVKALQQCLLYVFNDTTVPVETIQASLEAAARQIAAMQATLRAQNR